MNRTRAWRTATATLAASALMLMSAGPAAAQLPELPIPGLPGADEDGGDTDGDDTAGGGETTAIPEAGVGGFAGYARAEGATVFVGLPAELAEGLAPVLEGLGIAGTLDTDSGTLSGIRIDLARVTADLERAAAGEEVSSESTAFITNLLLASDGDPGSCTGGPMEVAVPPDTPLVTLTLLGVDCEETDARAFANVQIVGLNIGLAALLELGLPQEVADGVDQLIGELNAQLLAPVSDGLCQALEGILGVLLPSADECSDEAPLLQLRNPFDIDVPIVDLDAVGATAEVTQDGDSITATATSLFTGLNVLGVACIGGDNPPLEYTSTATSDGTTATRSASAPSLSLNVCQTQQSLLRILLGDGPLGDIGVFEAIVQDDLLDGALQELFDGVDTLLDTLTTEAITQGQGNLGPIEGAGTSASTDPFVVASTIPLMGLPGLGESPLGSVAVIVVGGATEVGVNALPAGVTPPAPPEQPVTPAGPPASPNLPRTGAGIAGLLGLAALGAAAALRRRDS